jgi:hypothetical protein
MARCSLPRSSLGEWWAESSEGHAPAPRFRPRLCPGRSAPPRVRAPRHSARLVDRSLAPRGRMKGRTCPRSRAVAAAGHASSAASWLRLHVGPVVVEQIGLNLRLTWLTEERKFVSPQIRVIAVDVGIAPNMTRPRRRQGQQIRAKGRLVCGAISPERASRVPVDAESFVVRPRLGRSAPGPGPDVPVPSESRQDLRSPHVQGVVLKAERLREVRNDVRVVVKGVCKTSSGPAIRCDQARIIRRDQVVLIGQARKQRLEHP